MGDKFKCIREFTDGYPFLGKMFLLSLFRPLFGVSAFCKTLLPSAPPWVSPVLHFLRLLQPSKVELMVSKAWSKPSGGKYASMLANLPRFLWSRFVLASADFFSDQLNNALKMIFEKNISALRLFHLEGCSECLVCYSAGNGGSCSLIFPLYVLLLSIRKETESLFFVDCSGS